MKDTKNFSQLKLSMKLVVDGDVRSAPWASIICIDLAAEDSAPFCREEVNEKVLEAASNWFAL